MLLLYFYCKLFLSINDVGREAAMGHNISLPVYDSKLKKKKKRLGGKSLHTNIKEDKE